VLNVVIVARRITKAHTGKHVVREKTLGLEYSGRLGMKGNIAGMGQEGAIGLCALEVRARRRLQDVGTP
jgi:hypothetical protein